jgi:phage shock protein A
MGIFKRLQDILSANMGEMIDSSEDPEPMLAQAIREMEAAIGEARRETARAMANEKLVRKELTENERQAQEWQQQAEKAIAAGDEGLARKALTRKREHGKVAAALQDQLSATTEASQTLRRQWEAMQVKRAEARRSLATLAARHKAAEARKRSWDVNFETDAFAKFDRINQKVEQAEAEAEAFRELAGGASAPLDVDLGTGDNEADVEAELAQLKKKLNQ